MVHLMYLSVHFHLSYIFLNQSLQLISNCKTTVPDGLTQECEACKSKETKPKPGGGDVMSSPLIQT